MPVRLGLFTGASTASRRFEALIAAGALVAGSCAVVHSSRPVAWPVVAVAAPVTVAAMAVGGLFALPAGQKTFWSPGSGAAFAVILALPAREALPISFVGMLLAQLGRRYHLRQRLTWQTIAFNQSQYVVTWSLASAAYARALVQLPPHSALTPWLPPAGAAIVYMLVNTWLVATWTALRRRAWAWDVWLRMLSEMAPAYSISLAAGAAAAAVSVRYPALAVSTISAAAAAHAAGVRASSTRLRGIVSAVAAIIEAAERGSVETVEHSERVSWWAERLARRLGVPESDADAIAMAARLHDLGKVALGVPLGDDPTRTVGQTALPQVVASDALRGVPGLEWMARALRSQEERYDGTGRPDGLAGEAIPLPSRIIAVAEAYDLALRRDPEAPGDGADLALARVRAAAGTRFDPRIVGALEAVVAADAPRAAPTLIPAHARDWSSAAALAASGAQAGAPSVAAGSGWFDCPWPADDAAEDRFPPALGIMERHEEERRRIARELHDEVGGTLTWLRCALGARPDLGAVREAQAHVEALITRIRDISLDLRPAALDDLGLAAALERHTERYTSLTGIRVHLRHAGLDRRFPAPIENAAFRIVQEALTNVARHAHVPEVTVRAHGLRRTLSVLVEDRGAGFDPDEALAAGRSSGLAGMRERALLLGGTFAVSSSPGTGTRVEAHLPIQTWTR